MSSPKPSPAANPAAPAPSSDSSSTPGSSELSKNAQKKLLKQQAKEQAKAAKPTPTPAAAGAGGEGKKKEEEEEVDPTKYFENRCRDLKEREASGKVIYPHKFHASISIPQFVHQYGPMAIEKGDKLTETVTIAGRVYGKRSAGQGLYFYELKSQGAQVQVVADKRIDQDDWSVHQFARRGNTTNNNNTHTQQQYTRDIHRYTDTWVCR